MCLDGLFGEPSEKDAALKVMADFKTSVADLCLSCATIVNFLPMFQWNFPFFIISSYHEVFVVVNAILVKILACTTS